MSVPAKRKRAKTVFIICLISALMIAAVIYVYAVYNGTLLLNNPSRKKYPVRGVDVSHYQGEIDWSLLAGQDISFAYIKATEGSTHLDTKFAYNWEVARQTALKTGAYHFFSFDSPGITQAEHFKRNVLPEEGMLPPVVDVEYYADKKMNPPRKEDVVRELQIFLDDIESHYNIRPVIYTTEEVWDSYLEGSFEAYPIWIRNVFTRPDKKIKWTFWQYSNRGKLEGYSGDEEFIDLNVFSGSEEAWERWLHGK